MRATRKTISHASQEISTAPYYYQCPILIDHIQKMQSLIPFAIVFVDPTEHLGIVR